MAMARVEGVRSLAQALELIPENLRKKVLRRALRKGAALVRDDARRIVRKRTRRLEKSIVIVPARSKVRGGVAFKVGLRARGFYGRFVEFGHVKRGRGEAIRGSVLARKRTREVDRSSGRFVPPYPFMRPASNRLPDALVVIRGEVSDAVRSGELLR